MKKSRILECDAGNYVLKDCPTYNAEVSSPLKNLTQHSANIKNVCHSSNTVRCISMQNPSHGKTSWHQSNTFRFNYHQANIPKPLLDVRPLRAFCTNRNAYYRMNYQNSNHYQNNFSVGRQSSGRNFPRGGPRVPYVPSGSLSSYEQFMQHRHFNNSNHNVKGGMRNYAFHNSNIQNLHYSDRNNVYPNHTYPVRSHENTKLCSRTYRPTIQRYGCEQNQNQHGLKKSETSELCELKNVDSISSHNVVNNSYPQTLNQNCSQLKRDLTGKTNSKVKKVKTSKRSKNDSTRDDSSERKLKTAKVVLSETLSSVEFQGVTSSVHVPLYSQTSVSQPQVSVCTCFNQGNNVCRCYMIKPGEMHTTSKMECHDVNACKPLFDAKLENIPSVTDVHCSLAVVSQIETRVDHVMNRSNVRLNTVVAVPLFILPWRIVNVQQMNPQNNGVGTNCSDEMRVGPGISASLPKKPCVDMQGIPIVGNTQAFCTSVNVQGSIVNPMTHVSVSEVKNVILANNSNLLRTNTYFINLPIMASYAPSLCYNSNNKISALPSEVGVYYKCDDRDRNGLTSSVSENNICQVTSLNSNHITQPFTNTRKSPPLPEDSIEGGTVKCTERCNKVCSSSKLAYSSQLTPHNVEINSLNNVTYSETSETEKMLKMPNLKCMKGYSEHGCQLATSMDIRTNPNPFLPSPSISVNGKLGTKLPSISQDCTFAKAFINSQVHHSSASMPCLIMSTSVSTNTAVTFSLSTPICSSNTTSTKQSLQARTEATLSSVDRKGKRTLSVSLSDDCNTSSKKVCLTPPSKKVRLTPQNKNSNRLSKGSTKALHQTIRDPDMQFHMCCVAPVILHSNLNSTNCSSQPSVPSKCNQSPVTSSVVVNQKLTQRNQPPVTSSVVVNQNLKHCNQPPVTSSVVVNQKLKQRNQPPVTSSVVVNQNLKQCNQPPVTSSLVVNQNLKQHNQPPVTSSVVVNQNLKQRNQPPVTSSLVVNQNLKQHNQPPVTSSVVVNQNLKQCNQPPVTSSVVVNQNLKQRNQPPVTSSVVVNQNLKQHNQPPVTSSVVVNQNLKQRNQPPVTSSVVVNQNLKQHNQPPVTSSVVVNQNLKQHNQPPVTSSLIVNQNLKQHNQPPVTSSVVVNQNLKQHNQPPVTSSLVVNQNLKQHNQPPVTSSVVVNQNLKQHNQPPVTSSLIVNQNLKQHNQPPVTSSVVVNQNLKQHNQPPVTSSVVVNQKLKQYFEKQFIGNDKFNSDGLAKSYVQRNTGSDIDTPISLSETKSSVSHTTAQKHSSPKQQPRSGLQLLADCVEVHSKLNNSDHKSDRDSHHSIIDSKTFSDDCSLMTSNLLCKSHTLSDPLPLPNKHEHENFVTNKHTLQLKESSEKNSIVSENKEKQAISAFVIRHRDSECIQPVPENVHHDQGEKKSSSEEISHGNSQNTSTTNVKYIYPTPVDDEIRNDLSVSSDSTCQGSNRLLSDKPSTKTSVVYHTVCKSSIIGERSDCKKNIFKENSVTNDIAVMHTDSFMQKKNVWQNMQNLSDAPNGAVDDLDEDLDKKITCKDADISTINKTTIHNSKNGLQQLNSDYSFKITNTECGEFRQEVSAAQNSRLSVVCEDSNCKRQPNHDANQKLILGTTSNDDDNLQSLEKDSEVQGDCGLEISKKLKCVLSDSLNKSHSLSIDSRPDGEEQLNQHTLLKSTCHLFKFGDKKSLSDAMKNSGVTPLSTNKELENLENSKFRSKCTESLSNVSNNLDKPFKVHEYSDLQGRTCTSNNNDSQPPHHLDADRNIKGSVSSLIKDRLLFCINNKNKHPEQHFDNDVLNRKKGYVSFGSCNEDPSLVSNTISCKDSNDKDLANLKNCTASRIQSTTQTAATNDRDCKQTSGNYVTKKSVSLAFSNCKDIFGCCTLEDTDGKQRRKDVFSQKIEDQTSSRIQVRTRYRQHLNHDLSGKSVTSMNEHDISVSNHNLKHSICHQKQHENRSDQTNENFLKMSSKRKMYKSNTNSDINERTKTLNHSTTKELSNSCNNSEKCLEFIDGQKHSLKHFDKGEFKSHHSVCSSDARTNLLPSDSECRLKTKQMLSESGLKEAEKYFIGEYINRHLNEHTDARTLQQMVLRAIRQSRRCNLLVNDDRGSFRGLKGRNLNSPHPESLQSANYSKLVHRQVNNAVSKSIETHSSSSACSIINSRTGDNTFSNSRESNIQTKSQMSRQKHKQSVPEQVKLTEQLRQKQSLQTVDTFNPRQQRTVDHAKSYLNTSTALNHDDRSSNSLKGKVPNQKYLPASNLKLKCVTRFAGLLTRQQSLSARLNALCTILGLDSNVVGRNRPLESHKTTVVIDESDCDQKNVDGDQHMSNAECSMNMMKQNAGFCKKVFSPSVHHFSKERTDSMTVYDRHNPPDSEKSVYHEQNTVDYLGEPNQILGKNKQEKKQAVDQQGVASISAEDKDCIHDGHKTVNCRKPEIGKEDKNFVYLVPRTQSLDERIKSMLDSPEPQNEGDVHKDSPICYDNFVEEIRTPEILTVSNSVDKIVGNLDDDSYKEEMPVSVCRPSSPLSINAGYDTDTHTTSVHSPSKKQVCQATNCTGNFRRCFDSSVRRDDVHGKLENEKQKHNVSLYRSTILSASSSANRPGSLIKNVDRTKNSLANKQDSSSNTSKSNLGYVKNKELLESDTSCTTSDVKNNYVNRGRYLPNLDQPLGNRNEKTKIPVYKLGMSESNKVKKCKKSPFKKISVEKIKKNKKDTKFDMCEHDSPTLEDVMGPLIDFRKQTTLSRATTCTDTSTSSENQLNKKTAHLDAKNNTENVHQQCNTCTVKKKHTSGAAPHSDYLNTWESGDQPTVAELRAVESDVESNQNYANYSLVQKHFDIETDDKVTYSETEPSNNQILETDRHASPYRNVFDYQIHSSTETHDNQKIDGENMLISNNSGTKVNNNKSARETLQEDTTLNVNVEPENHSCSNSDNEFSFCNSEQTSSDTLSNTEDVENDSILNTELHVDNKSFSSMIETDAENSCSNANDICNPNESNKNLNCERPIQECRKLPARACKNKVKTYTTRKTKLRISQDYIKKTSEIIKESCSVKRLSSKKQVQKCEKFSEVHKPVKKYVGSRKMMVKLIPIEESELFGIIKKVGLEEEGAVGSKFVTGHNDSTNSTERHLQRVVKRGRKPLCNSTDHNVHNQQDKEVFIEGKLPSPNLSKIHKRVNKCKTVKTKILKQESRSEISSSASNANGLVISETIKQIPINDLISSRGKSKWKQYPKMCLYCSQYIAKSKTDMRDHWREKHQFKCNRCHTDFKSQNEKLVHRKVHIKQVHHCTLCNMEYVTWTGYRKHCSSKEHLKIVKAQKDAITSLLHCCFNDRENTNKLWNSTENHDNSLVSSGTLKEDIHDFNNMTVAYENTAAVESSKDSTAHTVQHVYYQNTELNAFMEHLKSTGSITDPANMLDVLNKNSTVSEGKEMFQPSLGAALDASSKLFSNFETINVPNDWLISCNTPTGSLLNEFTQLQASQVADLYPKTSTPVSAPVGSQSETALSIPLTSSSTSVLSIPGESDSGMHVISIPETMPNGLADCDNTEDCLKKALDAILEDIAGEVLNSDLFKCDVDALSDQETKL